MQHLGLVIRQAYISFLNQQLTEAEATLKYFKNILILYAVINWHDWFKPKFTKLTLHVYPDHQALLWTLIKS